jgi:hypothetical protein
VIEVAILEGVSNSSCCKIRGDMLVVLNQNVLCKYSSDIKVNMSSAMKPDVKYVAIQYLALSLRLLR